MKAQDWLNSNPISEEKAQLIKEFKRRRDSLLAFNNCGSCGQKVDFDIQVFPKQAEVEEQICCPSCHAKAPRRRYRIH
jgi:hypothetical protein